MMGIIDGLSSKSMGYLWGGVFPGHIIDHMTHTTGHVTLLSVVMWCCFALSQPLLQCYFLNCDSVRKLLRVLIIPISIYSQISTIPYLKLFPCLNHSCFKLFLGLSHSCLKISARLQSFLSQVIPESQLFLSQVIPGFQSCLSQIISRS